MMFDKVIGYRSDVDHKYGLDEIGFAQPGGISHNQSKGARELWSHIVVAVYLN